MRNQKFSIQVIGGAVVDVKHISTACVIPETSNPVTTVVTHGGVGRNIVENLARLSVQTSFTSRVGKDTQGKAIIESLQKLKSCITGISFSEECATATYNAVLEPSGNLYVALADMRIFDEMTPDVLESSMKALEPLDVCLFDTNLPPETFTYLESECSSLGRIWAISVSQPKISRLKPILPYLDMLILNRCELEALTSNKISQPEELSKAAESVLELGCKQLIVTQCGHGVYYFSKDQALQYPVLKIVPRDVTGSVDAFCAGLLYGLQKHPIDKAIYYGMAAAQRTLLTHQNVDPHLTQESLESLAKDFPKAQTLS